MFNIRYKLSVEKDFKKIHRMEVKKIIEAIEDELPTVAHLQPKLQGKYKGLHKLRVGDYRVIFSIEDETVVILKVMHRKDIYR